MNMSTKIGAKLTAGAAALALAGLAGGAMAHPHPEGGDKVRKIMILEDGEKGEKGARHIVHLEGGRPMCAGEKTEVVEETGGDDKKQKTKIVICGGPDIPMAERAAKLQEAIDRVQANENLSAEHREKVTTALREVMDRLRAAQ